MLLNDRLPICPTSTFISGGASETRPLQTAPARVILYVVQQRGSPPSIHLPSPQLPLIPRQSGH